MTELIRGSCRYACGRPGVHYKGTMCHACYERDRRRAGGRFTAEHLFFARVSGETEAGCWLWGGNLKLGYGIFAHKGRRSQAHRWAYEFFRAEIPDGLVIDHLCRVPRCVNPWHMDPVTIAVNSLRGEAPTVVAARTGVCPRGHSLSDAYVVRSGPQKGRRNCRTCVRDRWAEKAADPEFRARRVAYERARKAASRA